MPIYEFYCPDCHTLFSFFAQSSKARRLPDCPRCHRPKLERRPSSFAMLRNTASSEDEPDPFSGLDERRLEGAIESLAVEAERMGDGEDPRAMSRLLRKFGEMTGLELGPKMEDALQRMERGDDLDSIDAELGDQEGDDSLDELFRLKGSMLRRSRRPAVDDELHFL